MRKLAILDARLIPPAIVKEAGISQGYSGYYQLLTDEDKRGQFVKEIRNNIYNWNSLGSPKRSAAEWQHLIMEHGGFRDVFIQYMTHLEAIHEGVGTKGKILT